MPKIIDLTHKFTKSMPVHHFDEPALIEKIRNLTDHKYNDWKLSSGMHIGTHIDGPGHLTESKTLLCDIPVDRFVGKGYLVDARNKAIDESLLKDLPAQDDLIVLILTGSDKLFGTNDYFNSHPVISVNFANELVRRKIKMIGIDFFSPDGVPSHDIRHSLTQPSHKATAGSPSQLTMTDNLTATANKYPFEIHKIFFQNNILIIENLSNLESLLGTKNFTIIALPLKTETDSALARVIAIVE